MTRVVSVGICRESRLEMGIDWLADPGSTVKVRVQQTYSSANRTSQHDSSPSSECSAKPEQCWTCDRLEPARRLVCQSSDCLSHIAWPFSFAVHEPGGEVAGKWGPWGPQKCWSRTVQLRTAYLHVPAWFRCFHACSGDASADVSALVASQTNQSRSYSRQQNGRVDGESPLLCLQARQAHADRRDAGELAHDHEGQRAALRARELPGCAGVCTALREAGPDARQSWRAQRGPPGLQSTRHEGAAAHGVQTGMDLTDLTDLLGR